MEYNCTSPLIDLGIKFSTEQSFGTGYTALKGNAFKFDNYKSAQTLRFFTTEQRDNAVLQLVAAGLVEGSSFDLTTAV